MSEERDFQVLADQLGAYFMRAYMLPYLLERGVIMSYRAQIISKDTAARTMRVQRPFDSPITVPYADGAADLTAGQQCVVLCFGSETNSLVVGSGSLSGFGGGSGGGGSGLPAVSAADNGKVLAVVNGEWAAAEITSIISNGDGTD